MTADPDLRATYAAEDRVAAWLDAHPASPVTVDGMTYSPEVEPRFTDPAAVSAYVERVLCHLRDSGKSYDGWEARAVSVRSRAGHRKAHYEPLTATIAVPSREVGGTWALRGLVVLHEMAHHLARAAGDEGHGAGFRQTFVRLLEDIGHLETARLLHDAYAAEGLALDAPAATGDDTLARIAKVLRQAERAANEHERAAFLAKAQQLATRHSVALAVARAHTAREETRQAPISESVTIGPFGARGLARYVRLLVNIALANDLKATVRTDNTLVWLHGFAEDVAATRALYESLLVQMVTDAEAYLATRPFETHTTYDARTRREVTRPVSTITARLAFYESYGFRIHQRLTEARDAANAAVRAEAATPELSRETAVALRQKELEVHDYYAEVLRRDNIRGSWRGDRRSSSAASSPASSRAGRSAADRAALGGERALPA